jgi:hypothetical protein
MTVPGVRATSLKFSSLTKSLAMSNSSQICPLCSPQYPPADTDTGSNPSPHLNSSPDPNSCLPGPDRNTFQHYDTQTLPQSMCEPVYRFGGCVPHPPHRLRNEVLPAVRVEVPSLICRYGPLATREVEQSALGWKSIVCLPK